MQAIKRFPEVIACSVEERLKENMAKLERDWKIKGPTAVNVIKRQPQACCCTLKSLMYLTNNDWQSSVADVCVGLKNRDMCAFV